MVTRGGALVRRIGSIGVLLATAVTAGAAPPYGRTIKITSVEREGGRLLLSGTESGGSWNLAVVEDSGAMSSVVLVRDGGFLMFGTCTSN
jgi:hypothetical protein